MVRGRHAREASPQQAVERAVRNAILASLLAEAFGVMAGRARWPSLLLVIVCVSYLVEAFDKWHVTRSLAQEAELHALLDAEDQLLQAA